MPEKPLSMREAIRRLAANAVPSFGLWADRFDSFTNSVTGFGTSRDKTEYGRVKAYVPLDDFTISNLLHCNDMAERMVSIVPAEMLREGFGVATDDPELDEDISEKFEALALRENLFEAIWGARGYGGGALILGADDGRDAAEPLDLDRVTDLAFVHAADRRFLLPYEFYEDPDHPKFGRPSVYSVTVHGGRGYSMSMVHESRLVLFRGATTGVQERQMTMGWDMSVLQRPHDVLRQFDTGWKAVENMLTDANQAIFKMTGLADIIGTPGGEQALHKRATSMDMFRSVVRALVVDADSNESFERQSVSFESIPNTLEKFMLRLAASVQIPVTILMGQSPAGMNATGESDLRWFQNRIRAEQMIMLAPRIRRIVQVYLRSKASPTKGKLPKSMAVTFPNLWTPSPLEAAQIRKTVAEGDMIYITAQAFTPDEVALERGRPGGFDGEIQLSDEAEKARKQALSHDLEQIAKGTPEEDEGHGGAGDGSSGDPMMGRFDAAMRRALGDAKLFELHRHEDETGVSGTGVIADGVVFPDGKVALRWRTETASTTFFDSVEDMLAVHGHGGKTEMVLVGTGGDS